MIPNEVRATIAAALQYYRRNSSEYVYKGNGDFDTIHDATAEARIDAALTWLHAQPAQEQQGTDALADAWPDLSHVPDGVDRFSDLPISGGDA